MVFCVHDGGIIAIIAIDANWGQENYEILNQAENSATVRVEGRIRITIENIDQYIEDLTQLEEVLPDLDIPEINLPRTGVGIQININYQEMEMKKCDQGWCVTKDGVYGFYSYILEQIISVLE